MTTAHLFNATIFDKQAGFNFALYIGVDGVNINFWDKLLFKNKTQAKQYCKDNSIECWNF